MRILTLAALAVTLAACGGSTEPAKTSVVGTYQLKTVNGATLPYVASQSGTSKSEITGDQLTLNADETFSEITSVRITSGATVTTSQVPFIGVYQATNGQIAFTQTSPTSLSFSGSVAGNTLTIIGSNTLVYGR